MNPNFSSIIRQLTLVREVRGKYAHLKMSSKAVAADKQREIAKEDKRR